MIGRHQDEETLAATLTRSYISANFYDVSQLET